MKAIYTLREERISFTSDSRAFQNLKLYAPDNSKMISENNCDGQIRKFYAGKQVFLTGCTGFVGILVLEKLLRTCKEISKIYIMVRDKKGVPIEERMKKLFKNDAYDILRETNPNFTEKIVPIYGDLYKNDLGLSAKDRQNLIENVNIIIHNASMVYFEVKVSVILRINVIGTQKMLELATECPNLDAFVYVSTAYSNHYNNPIEEKFYLPPADLKMVEDLIRADEECAAGVSKEVVNEMVGKFKNLYSFSKCIAESLVEDFGKRRSLPSIVFRPSIIVQTYQEPFPSWAETKNGPAQLGIGSTLGAVHTWKLDRKGLIGDFIPVDMTVNSLLALIWDYVTYRRLNGPAVYNYGSSDWNPLTMEQVIDCFMSAVYKNPSVKMVWYPWVVIFTSMFPFVVLHLLLHVIPAMIVDLIFVIQRKKPKLTGILLKLTKQYQVLQYFINGNWIIKTDNIKDILNRMNATDLEEFSFDLKTVDWHTNFELGLLAVRKIIKEPPDMHSQAMKKLEKLRILHYVVSGLFILFSLYFFYRIMCNIF